MRQPGFELDEMIEMFIFGRHLDLELDPDLGPVEVVPAYSKHDGRALDIVKHLNRRLYNVQMGTVDRIWYCTMYTDPNTRFTSAAKTLALAICNTALETVKELDKYKNN